MIAQIDIRHPTLLHILKSEHPNLTYDGGAFYRSDDENDPYCDSFLCLDGETENIDADRTIDEYFQWIECDTSISANWIKAKFGNYETAFKNTI